jgi:hypothetical protein
MVQVVDSIEDILEQDKYELEEMVEEHIMVEHKVEVELMVEEYIMGEHKVEFDIFYYQILDYSLLLVLEL